MTGHRLNVTPLHTRDWFAAFMGALFSSVLVAAIFPLSSWGRLAVAVGGTIGGTIGAVTHRYWIAPRVTPSRE